MSESVPFVTVEESSASRRSVISGNYALSSSFAVREFTSFMRENLVISTLDRKVVGVMIEILTE
jgi:hypothetical protein